jgi:tetratricopeptide (TPR) repeat protein
MAYQQQGRLAEAASAYEQSLHFLANNPEYSAQYAGVLNAYATLYRDTGQVEIAWKMQLKALRLYDGINDQAGIADVCNSLAILAISQKRTRKARGYLRCASEASRVANGLNDDYFAALSSTQAWVEQVDKHYAAAASDYQRSLTLWKHLHGDQHFLVGWGYMLLGEANAQARDMTPWITCAKVWEFWRRRRGAPISSSWTQNWPTPKSLMPQANTPKLAS